MVRVVTADHAANAIEGPFVDSAMQILPKDCIRRPGTRPAEYEEIEILQSSFDEDKLSSALLAADNGLVRTVVDSYCKHYHLQLRPEDVWFAILSQLSIYINANAESLRSKFVEHEGQKELKIEYNCGDRYSFDFGVFAREMTQLLHENILDQEFRDWVLTDFSTTHPQDRVIASILMMGTMQKYFSYTCGLACGIPSVTLMGEKADYEKILDRLDYLSTLGKEPEHFAAVLRPVLSRIIRTFDDPKDPAVVNFWQRIVDRNSGSGMTTYTGWISAFCFWDEKGRCLHSSRGDDDSTFSEDGVRVIVHEGPDGSKFRYRQRLRLSLDGVCYRGVDSKSIPPGWCKVPVKVDDNGTVVDTEMVAGSVGIACSSSGLENVKGSISLDTMQPEIGWWIYEKKPNEGSSLKATGNQLESLRQMSESLLGDK